MAWIPPSQFEEYRLVRPLVATPARKILLVLGAVEKTKAKKYDRTVEKFIASIKPAK